MRRKILMVDNYDSFTYNIVHYLEGIDDVEVDVRSCDDLTGVSLALYDGIVISPGPGLPSESGQLVHFTKKACSEKPILGICLGLQAIVEEFGGKLINMKEVLHGRQTPIYVLNKENPLFKSLPDSFMVGRYHSWVAEKHQLPSELEVIAEDEQKQIMAVSHRKLPIHALQFHPESIMSPHGKQIINNWLSLL